MLQGIHAYASSLLGKRGYLGLFSFLTVPHKREDPVAFIANKCFDSCLGFLCSMSNTPPTPWQSGQPLDLVPTCCPSGPSRPYVPPLSALCWQHVRTFHAGLLTGGESATPTLGIHQEKAQHLVCTQLLSLRFPFL